MSDTMMAVFEHPNDRPMEDWEKRNGRRVCPLRISSLKDRSPASYDRLVESYLVFASLACAFGTAVNVNTAWRHSCAMKIVKIIRFPMG
ncbi:hypothetical protein FVF58_06225 [Paraburkholderia panacisoli]|uniref:Uncharacterized protein n=1 Tax=Paraburkholderia panacisoli TaxID=2603818 RepID=A0A5B0HGX1_9BURK|nr:hypothetical protein FVF58_06225 [Paraburkholderia panacisoli]